MFTIIGAVIVLASVVLGFVLEGGHLLALWHPLELVIIGGAAIGAFVISNPLKVIKAAVGDSLNLLKGPRYKREDYVDILNLLYDILVKIRKSGMLAVEADIETPDKSALFGQYPRIQNDHHFMEFTTDCLRLMVGGNLDPNELESLLEYELENHHKESAEPAHAMARMGDGLPGFGIVAAVLGIVITMGSIAGPIEKIGEKVGAALVGTFLGIFISYGFMNPMAVNMEFIGMAQANYLRCIAKCVAAFASGMAPVMACEMGRRGLSSDLRTSADELETMLKAAVSATK
jgi:chemotaxis protein MotA